MEPVSALVPLFLAAAAAFAFIGVRREFTKWRNKWRDALYRLSTKYPMTIEITEHGAKGTGDTPEGKLVVDLFHEAAGESSRTYTRVRLHSSMPQSLSISAEGLVSKLAKLAGADDVLTGDRSFDADVLLQGSSRELRARLSHAARKLLLTKVLAGLRIQSGTIDWRHPGRVHRAHELEGMVRTVLEVARALRVEDVATALYENASHDPEAGVRLECAAELVQMGAATPDRMRRWLDHGDLRLRLIAARQLGDQGFDALTALADPRTLVGQEALRVLAVRFRDRAAPTLRHHEEALRNEIAGIPARVERDGILALPNPSDLKAQIHLLGAIGTIDSVETLLMPHLPRGAAREAIREIQERIPGAEGGRLTVADSAGGELSDVPDEGGVALADPTRTRTRTTR